MAQVRITTPLTDEVVEKLTIGQQVLISGKIYTARDAAHKKLVDLLKEGKPLPIDIEGQIVYYVGPSPAKPGQVIGSAGPTTSGRMDAYAPTLMGEGLKGMIGKGSRTKEVIEAMQKYKAVYFAAVGGAAALIAKKITSSKVIAYPELGPEAIHELIVEDLPVIVVNDIYGRDLYQEGIKNYAIND
ncbi:MAG: Fe-S-containing hydro-lyase [Clostridia bacterium]|nr:Fe-S-containing hydro-lyase [Clostridia bacterium]